jgi:hypothetical protein
VAVAQGAAGHQAAGEGVLGENAFDNGGVGHN